MSQDKTQLPARVKSFVALQRHGVLSTISAGQEGFPFGSITPYDLDELGRPIIYISLIAEHYKNLKQDARACLTISDPFGYADPQAFGRASLLVKFTQVPEAELSAVQKRYEERFPRAVNYEIAHNFLFMRGELVKIRWIGGFGEIAWIDVAKFQAATLDPVAYSGYEILDHMNRDHSDALRDYALGLAGIDPGKNELKMAAVDRSGFELRLYTSDEVKPIPLKFPNPLAEAGEARREMIALLKEARAKINS